MNAVVSPRSFADVRQVPAAVQTLRRTFVVGLKHGLHARMCAILVKTLQPYRLTVEVEANGERASGKSILGLMALGAGHGAKISFSMAGEAAADAMGEIERLFASNFGTV